MVVCLSKNTYLSLILGRFWFHLGVRGGPFLGEFGGLLCLFWLYLGEPATDLGVYSVHQRMGGKFVGLQVGTVIGKVK